MRRFLLVLLSFALLAPAADLGAQVPSPREVLGYRLGESFTTPPQATEYARRLAGASDRVGRRVYGRTPEARPLHHPPGGERPPGGTVPVTRSSSLGTVAPADG